jgi:hypothetical protein
MHDPAYSQLKGDPNGDGKACKRECIVYPDAGQCLIFDKPHARIERFSVKGILHQNSARDWYGTQDMGGFFRQDDWGRANADERWTFVGKLCITMDTKTRRVRPFAVGHPHSDHAKALWGNTPVTHQQDVTYDLMIE